MDSPIFHPSKNYIKAVLDFSNINTDNLSDDIIIPFFIDYSSVNPFVLFVFQKNTDNELDFIKNTFDVVDNKTFLSELLEIFYTKNCTVNHKHICFYEISSTTPLELSGTFCNNNTFLWFSTPYEIYNTKSLWNLSFHDNVLSFFESNPSLNELTWNNQPIPTPIVAYSFDTIKNTIFQSTFGSKRALSEPYYTLFNYQKVSDISYSSYSGVVRYALFEPFETTNEYENNEIYTFSNTNQHTPLCFFTSTITQSDDNEIPDNEL